MNRLYVDKGSSITSSTSGDSTLTAANGATVYNDGIIALGDNGLLIMDSGSTLAGSGTFGNEVQINAGATVLVGNSPGRQTYTDGADLNIVSGNSTIRFYADGVGIAGAMQGWGSGTCSNLLMGAGSELVYSDLVDMNFQVAFSEAYLMSLGEAGTQASFVLIQYADTQTGADMTALATYLSANLFCFVGMDGEVALGPANVDEMRLEWDSGKNAFVYSGTIKGLVPEPSTATLGILGLAGLLLRRRRSIK